MLRSLVGSEMCIRDRKRYVDDTFAFIKPDTADEIQHILNSFHEKIKFAYEYEQSNTISFLNVLVTRSNNVFFRRVFIANKHTHRCVPQLECTRTYGMEDLNNQKPGQTSILYLINRNSAELSHLQKVFTTFNNYPNKVVDNIINTERTQTVTTLNEEDQPLKNNETVTLTLPYAGQKGELMMKKMKKMKKTVTDALNNPNNKVQHQKT